MYSWCELGIHPFFFLSRKELDLKRVIPVPSTLKSANAILSTDPNLLDGKSLLAATNYRGEISILCTEKDVNNKDTYFFAPLTTAECRQYQYSSVDEAIEEAESDENDIYRFDNMTEFMDWLLKGNIIYRGEST